MDTTARIFTLAHLLWPDGAWDVLLRVEGDGIAAGVYSADGAGDDAPLARVVADDGVSALDALAATLCRLAAGRARELLAATGAPLDDGALLRAASLASQLAASERALTDATRALAVHADRFGALAGIVHDLAAGRETYASDLAGLPADVADAVAILGRRVDPQAVDRAPSGGAVDLSVWVRRSDVAALCDREAHARGRVSSGGLAVAYVGGMVTSGLELPPHMRDRAQGSADEGDEARERGAQGVRVILGEGALAFCGGTRVCVGERISVYGGDGNGLAGHEGQQARLVVEVAGHVATLAPVESERQSRGEVSP